MKLEFESNIADAPPIVNGDYAAANASETTEKDASQLLRAGIKAAQDGNRREARALLLQATEVEPENENAWLWLASISDYPEELLVFLNNILNVNPHNERALEWAHATKSLLAKNFVQRGVDASNEAQMDLAKQCFLQAVVHDERNEMAWFWLASIADSAEEKLSHLQKVLTINPANETALTALQTTKTQVTESLMRKANMAAIAGDRTTAGETLQKVLDQTPDLEEAWILKSYLAESFSDKIVCFEQVLAINPNNDAAISGLASLREMIARTERRKTQNIAAAAALLSEIAENEAAEVARTAEAANNAELTDENDSPTTTVFADTPDDFKENHLPTESADNLAAFAPAENSDVSLFSGNFESADAFSEDENYQSATEPTAFNDQSGATEIPLHFDYSSPDSFAPTVEAVENSASSDENPALPIENAVKRVMVIDDSLTVRNLIARRLETSGYEVICSANGIEALAAIQQVVPDLILLDTVMPEMDGYQICQSIRENEATKDVPIVLISGRDGFFDKVRGQMSGSTGYIAKPFGPETLMKTVETYIV